MQPRASADIFDLYERAAQSPDMQARFLRALHGGRAGETVTLAEDFCGTGAVSRAWVALDPAHRAVCADRDPEPIARLRERAAGDDRIIVLQSDVLDVNEPAGVIAVLNFSICEIHTRPALVRYLSHTRGRLVDEAGAPGALVLDIYGGIDAMCRGESEIELRGGVRYVWEQREADPLTGMVENAMHFFPRGAKPIRDAFVYRWRLWSVPELRDALAEAGFARVAVYDRLGDAIDTDGAVHVEPIVDPGELDENYVVYLAARTG